MKQIPLSQRKFALVDDEDFDFLNKFKWYAHKGGNTYYAVIKENWFIVTRMHRLILGVENECIIIDHIDRNGLNNQKSNLRICNNSENQANRIKKRFCSSNYKGVYFDKKNNKWICHFNRKHIGYFDSEIEAAITYDAAAINKFGEFARTNF